MNIYNSDRDFLLNFAIENNRTDIAKFILENPKFDPNTCDILSAFTFYVKNITQESIDMLNIIYNYDKEHLQIINFNNLLLSGESFFTLIGSQQYDSSLDCKIATFFIEHGADPNKPDRKGFYPLEYAILRESTEYVRALINSNKIDFTQFVDMKNSYENPPEECLKASKAKKKTFLHIAARSKNPEILKIIIEKNAIDINSTDELGETPLFEACRYKQIKNIEYLATLSTIDYNHCNNEGYDVLKIMKIIMNLNFDFEITDRDDYFVALMSTFNTDKNNDLCYINYYHLD